MSSKPELQDTSHVYHIGEWCVEPKCSRFPRKPFRELFDICSVNSTVEKEAPKSYALPLTSLLSITEEKSSGSESMDVAAGKVSSKLYGSHTFELTSEIDRSDEQVPWLTGINETYLLSHLVLIPGCSLIGQYSSLPSSDWNDCMSPIDGNFHQLTYHRMVRRFIYDEDSFIPLTEKLPKVLGVLFSNEARFNVHLCKPWLPLISTRSSLSKS